MRVYFYIFIYAVCLFWGVQLAEEILSKRDAETNTGLISDSELDKRMLIFSLLDGSFVAVDRTNGELLWKHEAKTPVVSVPRDTGAAILPLYLPDPRDGSIYLLPLDSWQPVRKLPFSIPQLVASAPCRSSDSILYTGSKRDTWFALDRATGEMREVLGWGGRAGDSTCPAAGGSHVYLGRTQYTVLMVDSKNDSRRWNVSFSEFSAPQLTKEELSAYELVHIASSSSGHIVSLDRRSGALLWRLDAQSPVVGAYLLGDAGLSILPFTSASAQTLAAISSVANTAADDMIEYLSQQKLYPTLYIGAHDLGGLYALPSLLERPGISLSDSSGLPLLQDDSDSPLLLMHTLPYRNSDGRAIYLGHYHVPDYTSSSEDEIHPLQIFAMNGRVIERPIMQQHKHNQRRENAGYITHVTTAEKPELVMEQSDNESQGDIPSPNDIPDKSQSHLTVRNLTRHLYHTMRHWLDQQEYTAIKLLLIIIVGVVVAMMWYVRMQLQEMRQISQSNAAAIATVNGSSGGGGGNGSRGSSRSSSKQYMPQGSQSGSEAGADDVTAGSGSLASDRDLAVTELLDNGDVRVGKIQFNPQDLLGKGCEGTFVFRGTFDGRQVAVKRLLPECFSLADREVALLRESDAHPHVIRYHCTEQDRLFRYIALELCEATLHDYITRKRLLPLSIPAPTLIRQVALGLDHLHALSIVHRDIKPQNVLLTVDGGGRGVRAMISDFGLCKKVQEGHVSFSRRSGVTGTDGWMAPEMLLPANRPTFAVDLFSLGCVIYYVISDGAHPFGDALHRQANIQTHSYSLASVHQMPLWRHLVGALLHREAERRPRCELVLRHPALWEVDVLLTFLQDVSDCVERRCRRATEEGGATSPTATLPELVYGSDVGIASIREAEVGVVRVDWRAHVDAVVLDDLKKYRTYTGASVRDLLRALRNKRNHYRELTEEAQQTLGSPPGDFCNYWTSRFPHLVLYTWLAMQQVGYDASVRSHYHPRHEHSLFPLGNLGNSNTSAGDIQLLRRLQQLSEHDRQLGEQYRVSAESEEREREVLKQRRPRRGGGGGSGGRGQYSPRQPQGNWRLKTLQ